MEFLAKFGTRTKELTPIRFLKFLYFLTVVVPKSDITFKVQKHGIKKANNNQLSLSINDPFIKLNHGYSLSADNYKMLHEFFSQVLDDCLKDRIHSIIPKMEEEIAGDE